MEIPFFGRKPQRSASGGEQLCFFTARPILHQSATPDSLKSAIVELQQLLQLRGLLSTISGKFDSDTKTAVIQFQKANQLYEDGIVGPLTWACLFHPPLSRKLNDSSSQVQEAIRELQLLLETEVRESLRDKNFKIKDSAGVFGKDTERWVRWFQRVYGLQADGVVGAWTWAVLLGVRQKNDKDTLGSLILLMQHHLFLWEQVLMVLSVLIGICFSPLPGAIPLSPAAIVTAIGLTCVTPFLLNRLKLQPPNPSNLPLLQYAPFVLTGIFWKPVLAALVKLLAP